MNGQGNKSPTCNPVVILCLIKIFHEKMSSILPAHTNEAQQTCHNVMALLLCGLSLRLISKNLSYIFTDDGAHAKAIQLKGPPPPKKKILTPSKNKENNPYTYFTSLGDYNLSQYKNEKISC